MLGVTFVAFGLAWWLGLYLLSRSPGKAVTRRAGFGLLAYAAAVACEPFSGLWMERLQYVLVAAPALAWSGVLLGVLPDEWQPRSVLDRVWRYAVVPIVAVVVFAALVGGTSEILALPLVLLPLLGALVLVGAHARRIRPASTFGILVVATLLFGLGASALLVPLNWFPSGLLLAGIGLDFALLGLAVAVFDAFDEGESLLSDMSRSLLGSALAAALFGSQVGLVMWSQGASLPLVSLMLGAVATAVVVVVLAGRIQGALDRVVFAGAPQMRSERGELRSVSEALPRRAATELAELDIDEFSRLTRQALRHYSDLGKLVSNPLTDLPVLEKRIAERGVDDHSLERARELKLVLGECVQQLRPSDDVEFGTADEWRHYNSLFFFYVTPIRPYRNYPDLTGLGPPARQALEWFRTAVPERTLHNWQQAATRVVAMDLKARGWQ